MDISSKVRKFKDVSKTEINEILSTEEAGEILENLVALLEIISKNSPDEHEDGGADI